MEFSVDAWPNSRMNCSNCDAPLQVKNIDFDEITCSHCGAMYIVKNGSLRLIRNLNPSTPSFQDTQELKRLDKQVRTLEKSHVFPKFMFMGIIVFMLIFGNYLGLNLLFGQPSKSSQLVLPSNGSPIVCTNGDTISISNGTMYTCEGMVHCVLAYGVLYCSPMNLMKTNKSTVSDTLRITWEYSSGMTTTFPMSSSSTSQFICMMSTIETTTVCYGADYNTPYK